MLEGVVIINVVDVLLPEPGTLPEPVQPVQIYCVSEAPATGDVTDVVTFESESNQPLAGLGEPCVEVTVK
jgi:hypothetical protein